MTSLKDKLTQATSKLFGSAPKAVVVPFELICDCGHRVAGIRKSTDQIVNCSACRAALYVLPSDPYPAVRSPKGESRDGPVPTLIPDRGQPASPEDSQTEAQDVAVDGEADQEIEEVVHSPSKDRPGRRKTSRSPNARKEPTNETPPPVAEEFVPIPRVSFRDRVKRWFAPTRLLAVGLIVLVIGTSWWIVQQRRAEEARKAWRREMDLVAPALKDGDFDVLNSALQKAVNAARVLNRRDAEVLEAESLLNQTLAVKELSDLDLFSIIAEVTNEQGVTDEVKAKDVAAILQNQRLIFDTTLKAAPVRPEDAVSRTVPLMELNCSISIHSTPVRIGIASQKLNELVAAAKDMSLVFVATVRTVHVPQSAGKSWQIELDGDSVVLITTPLHARFCGLDAVEVEGLEARLEKQKAFVRGKESNSNPDDQQPEKTPAASDGKDGP